MVAGILDDFLQLPENSSLQSSRGWDAVLKDWDAKVIKTYLYLFVSYWGADRCDKDLQTKTSKPSDLQLHTDAGKELLKCSWSFWN